MTNSAFIQTLQSKLPASTNADRDAWAKHIIDSEISVSELLPLLGMDFKIASRTLWLCSQIALANPTYLRPYLWAVYEQFEASKIKGGEASIANQWLICGIPEEREGKAIDLLFEWMSSSEMNTTTKSRAQKTLEKLAKTYPQLRNELDLRSSSTE